MPITVIEPTSALVAIDLQKTIVARPIEDIPQVVDRSAKLVRAFRAAGHPVVLVNVTGGAPGRTQLSRAGGEMPPDGAELIPELETAPSDHRVTKKTWGAFTNTDLDAYLRSRGVNQIILVGIATSIGVESTARFAYELGYDVVLVSDAMTDMSPQAHQNSVERIFPRLGEVGTAQEVCDLLGEQASRP